MSVAGLRDLDTPQIETKTPVVGTDLVPVFVDKQSLPKFVAASELTSAGILGSNNAFTGDNTFAGTSGFNGAVSIGKSGTAGDISVYPATGSKGKLAVTVQDQTGNTTVTLDVDEHGQATVVNLPDGGAATTNLVQSTLPLTLVEADVLDGATAGTQVASKAVIANSDTNIGVVKATQLHIGGTGAETQVTASAAELNYNDVTTAGTIQATKAVILDANLHQNAVNTTSLSLGSTGSAVAVTSSAAELNYNDITAAGTAQASKALVCDGSVDISGINELGATTVTVTNFNATDIDAGASGTAGSLDVFPTTASKGKLTLACTDQAGDTAVTLNANAMAAARTINIADPGSASYIMQSTAAITLAEADVLDAVVAGTVSASKAVVVDGSKDVGDFRNLSSTNVLAGKDAVAGTVTVFPATTAKGITTITSSDNSGATTTNVNVAAQSGARTITLPDGGQATASILLTEGAQTVAGVQTYTVPQVIDANTAITAFGGGGQGSAVALTGEYNDVTTVAAPFDSVKLLAAVAGQTQIVKNSGASILSVFPNTDDTINALAANLSVDIPVGGEVTFRATGAVAYETIETLYLSSPTTQTGGLAIKAAANASNVDVTITNASQAAARTYTIADAGASAEFVMNIDTTDHVKFLGLNDIIGGPVDGPSVGTWTVTRLSRGDYVTQKTATDETAVIGIDITEDLRTTSSKGLKLVSFDVIFRNVTGNLDAHSVTLDKVNYTDSAAVTVTSVALTGALGVGQDNDPQVDNVTLDSAAFNITDDSKYVMEVTVDAGAGSVYDFIGIMLKFTRNDK